MLSTAEADEEKKKKDGESRLTHTIRQLKEFVGPSRRERSPPREPATVDLDQNPEFKKLKLQVQSLSDNQSEQQRAINWIDKSTADMCGDVRRMTNMMEGFMNQQG